MHTGKVSVVIPAYNQANFLGETIETVLNQTWSDVEVIVVNDASPDHTALVVNSFNDPRLKYIEHKKNHGLPGTRNTGMQAATGEFIALLDADDLFHLDKLQTHIDFFNKHPEIGVTYNPRFNLNHSTTTIRDLWRPPVTVDLSDFVLGFPFSPSDMVLRKTWAFKVNLFDEGYVSGGEDLDFPCRLALAGCNFASVNKALNYRRFHSGRKKKNLQARMADYTRALNNTFSDPHCPAQVQKLNDKAFVNYRLEVAYVALSQNETDLGQNYISKIIKTDSTILEGTPSRLVNFLLKNSIADEANNHEKLLQNIFSQLPPEAKTVSESYNWAVAQGYLLKGTRAALWDRNEDAATHFAQASKLRATIDDAFLQQLINQILSYEAEFDSEAAYSALQRITTHINKLGHPKSSRQLRGLYSVNNAFKDFYAGNYKNVPKEVFGAVANNPGYLKNRGVLAILFRSILGIRPG